MKMECKYCKYYEYDRRIECCHGHGEIQIGKCLREERTYGNLTMGNIQGCEVFERREQKYEKGMVFVGFQSRCMNGKCRTEKRAVCIISVQPEYAPAIYRVRDNWQSEYSMAEEDLDNYARIILGKEKEDGAV